MLLLLEIGRQEGAILPYFGLTTIAKE